MNRFRTTFALVENSHSQILRTVCTDDSIAAVKQSIEEDPNALGLRTYKIQFVPELKPYDYQASRTFGVWAENEMVTDPYFHFMQDCAER